MVTLRQFRFLRWGKRPWKNIEDISLLVNILVGYMDAGSTTCNEEEATANMEEVPLLEE